MVFSTPTTLSQVPRSPWRELAKLRLSRNETIAHLQRWGVTSDYVAGEYVHKEELTDTGLMRVVPTTVNILTERYFGAFRRLFGYQLGMVCTIDHSDNNRRGVVLEKLMSLSMIALLSEAINPGEDWLRCTDWRSG